MVLSPAFHPLGNFSATRPALIIQGLILPGIPLRPQPPVIANAGCGPCSAHTARSGQLHTSQLCAIRVYWCHFSWIGGLCPSALLVLPTNVSLAASYCRMRPSARASMSFCPSASLNRSTTLFIPPISCLHAAQIENTCASWSGRPRRAVGGNSSLKGKNKKWGNQKINSK